MSGKKKGQNALTDINIFSLLERAKFLYCVLFKSFSSIIFFQKDKIKILKRFPWSVLKLLQIVFRVYNTNPSSQDCTPVSLQVAQAQY